MSHSGPQGTRLSLDRGAMIARACISTSTTRIPNRMPTKAPALAPEVALLLANLAHPLEPAIRTLRAAVLAADPRIAEGIKWNSPSYHLAGAHFATFHLRSKAGVQLVLHMGAKVRPDAAVRAAVPDPDGLLEWKSPDRATLTVRDAADAAAKASALTAIARVWVQHL